VSDDDLDLQAGHGKTASEVLAEHDAKLRRDTIEEAAKWLLGHGTLGSPAAVAGDMRAALLGKQAGEAPKCPKCKDRGIRDMGKVRCECQDAATAPAEQAGEVCGDCDGHGYRGYLPCLSCNGGRRTPGRGR
jgi:hypothetical protein